jgi:hypothetical protein
MISCIKSLSTAPRSFHSTKQASKQHYETATGRHIGIQPQPATLACHRDAKPVKYSVAHHLPQAFRIRQNAIVCCKRSRKYWHQSHNKGHGWVWGSS